MTSSGDQRLEPRLIDFPADWDLKLLVCCRGETGHGPLGVRRWSAIAIFRTPTHEEIMSGKLPMDARLQTTCCTTPLEAVEEAEDMIARGDYTIKRDAMTIKAPKG